MPPLLEGMLQLAVPMWIEELRKLSPAEFEARRAACVEVILMADSLACGDSKLKKGKVAFEFNRLAEGIGILSFQVGGVRFGGARFDASVRPLCLGFNLDSIAEDVL